MQSYATFRFCEICLIPDFYFFILDGIVFIYIIKTHKQFVINICMLFIQVQV